MQAFLYEINSFYLQNNIMPHFILLPHLLATKPQKLLRQLETHLFNFNQSICENTIHKLAMSNNGMSVKELNTQFIYSFLYFIYSFLFCFIYTANCSFQNFNCLQNKVYIYHNFQISAQLLFTAHFQ